MVSPTNVIGQWQSSIGTHGTLTVARLDDELTSRTGTSSAVAGQKVRGTHGAVPHERTRVFVSYSHRDSDWLDRIRVHLKPLERDYAIDVWDDRKIRAGANWRKEIELALRSARVALLVVSADFLASEFIFNNELPPLLDAAANEGAVVLSLIVSPCRFRSTTLSQLQAINDPSRPLINMSKGEQEEILVKASKQVEIALKSTVSL
jgi:hypothetical protein